MRVEVPVDVLAERAKTRRGVVASRAEVQVAGRHVELLVPEAARHYWSPWLSVTLEADGDHATLVRGRFGPHPAVWTFFMSVQMFLLFSFIFALMAAVSLLIVGDPARWPWIVVAVSFVGMFGMYLGSLLGQRLGHDQMEDLHRALDDLLDVTTHDAEPYESLRMRRRSLRGASSPR